MRNQIRKAIRPDDPAACDGLFLHPVRLFMKSYFCSALVALAVLMSGCATTLKPSSGLTHTRA